jgi:hypothetical protein
MVRTQTTIPAADQTDPTLSSQKRLPTRGTDVASAQRGAQACSTLDRIERRPARRLAL